MNNYNNKENEMKKISDYLETNLKMIKTTLDNELKYQQDYMTFGYSMLSESFWLEKILALNNIFGIILGSIDGKLALENIYKINCLPFNKVTYQKMKLKELYLKSFRLEVENDYVKLVKLATIGTRKYYKEIKDIITSKNYQLMNTKVDGHDPIMFKIFTSYLEAYSLGFNTANKINVLELRDYYRDSFNKYQKTTFDNEQSFTRLREK